MFLGVLKGNFADRVVNVLHDNLELEDLDLARILVEGDLDVHGLAVLARHSAAHGLFKGVDEQVAVNAPVLANLVDGFFQLRHVNLRFFRLSVPQRR